jgi:acetaldehyde dehydrogenase (acetylating)
LPQPALVGKPATTIAEKAGISVPVGTRALMAPLAGVGRDFPLSIEKLCPVLSYYVVKDWREGCERCKEILRYGGMGHTMSIHSRNEEVILEFGLHKPAYRICVNTSTTHGSIGLTTGLDPAMTLGCGGFGGNITSDNITPRHLLNIKRLAYELRPAQVSTAMAIPASAVPAAPSTGPRLPQVPVRAASGGISSDALSRRIDQFLQSRGFGQTGQSGEAARPTTPTQKPARPVASAAPVDFVCEDDVRQAIKGGLRITLAERSIVTPAARELGETHKIFDSPGVTLPR